MNAKTTDWTSYYQATPRYTSITRRISALKISNLLGAAISTGSVSVCELGGANSCFVEHLYTTLPIAKYHIIDLNQFGLSLLEAKSCRNLTWEQADVLAEAPQDEQFDIVFSVGLVEHFEPTDTARAIASHFARCKPGGLVLITFPTPTLPYRIIRSAAERLRYWSFPDERPLHFQEVEFECLKYGQVQHSSINWWIGLTQGYLLTRKYDV